MKQGNNSMAQAQYQFRNSKYDKSGHSSKNKINISNDGKKKTSAYTRAEELLAYKPNHNSIISNAGAQ